MRNSQMTTLQELAFFVPGQIDSDGDGTTDADETVAGTDPIDPHSRFQITSYSENDKELMIKWSSVPGRSSSIQYREILASGDSWLEVGRVEANAAHSQFERTVSTDQKAGGFYRVLVRE